MNLQDIFQNLPLEKQKLPDLRCLLQIRIYMFINCFRRLVVKIKHRISY